MHLYILDERLWFPPLEDAMDDGLLAIGGDLSTERLLLAYHSGIFPWYDDGPPLWWSPDPRFVLFPNELQVHKSMRPYVNQPKFRFTCNTAFRLVMQNCKQVSRKGQEGTWIQPETIDAYCRLHELGYAHSAEAWEGDTMVGGLYGIKLGQVFFGESMFTHRANASKFAFIKLVQQLQEQGIQLIDCQVYTHHLETMGARMIPRSMFADLLSRYAPR